MAKTKHKKLKVGKAALSKTTHKKLKVGKAALSNSFLDTKVGKQMQKGRSKTKVIHALWWHFVQLSCGCAQVSHS